MNAQELQKIKYKKMVEEPVEKLVIKMAIPTIISMLITSFYNIADTFFVSLINSSATAAVGVIFSLMSMFQAIGFCFGHGSGNYISRKLGAKENEAAVKMASTGFFSAFFIGVIITIIGIIFLNPLAKVLGATDSILPYAKNYMGIILIGAPFMISSFVLNNQLRLQGNASYAMIGIATGAVLNVILDPILIFKLNMGIKGAALATVTSQIVSFSLLIKLCDFGGTIPIRFKNFEPNINKYKEILHGGLPSLCRQGITSFATIFLNVGAGAYGDGAVAAMSVVMRITTFASSALIGFGQGFQPVCGFNYGAKNYKRVGNAFWFCVKVSTVVLTILGILGIIFAPDIVSLFTKDDSSLIAVGVKALRMHCIAFPFLGWIILCNMLLQNIGKYVKASILAIARQGLCFIPMIIILPRIFGITGIQISQLIADLLTFIIALPMGMSTLKEFKSMSEKDGKNLI